MSDSKSRVCMRLGIGTINQLTDGAERTGVDRSAYLQGQLERALERGLSPRVNTAILFDALGDARERIVFKLCPKVVRRIDALAAGLGISRTLWAILAVAR